MTDKLEIEIEKVEVTAGTRMLVAPVYNPDDYEEHDPERYRSIGSVEYKPAPSQCWLSVPICEFLYGKPWDNVALAYVSGAKPSSIRVTTGMVHLDSRVGRVTVFVDDKNIITSIDQEQCVSVPETIVNGSALRNALAYGEDSPQCQWYNDDKITGFVGGLGGYHKMLNDGTSVPFPVVTNEHN